MSTLNKLISKEVRSAVTFVALGFLALQLFFNFVDELQWIGKHGNNYQLRHALQYALLQVPVNLYELMPITVLIGAIFVMARLAQSSEFTILRTSGLGPWRALRHLSGLGLFFSLFTLALGDYVAPAADRTGQLIKAKYQGRITTGLTGAWLRERQPYSSSTVNIANMNADTEMEGVRIFEFDPQGAVVSITRASKAVFGGDDDSWDLQGVTRTEFKAPALGAAVPTLPDAANTTSKAQKLGQGASAAAPNPELRELGAAFATAPPRLERTSMESLRWPNTISSEMVAAALLKPERMRTWDLYQYMSHLKANGQESQRFEIQFWRKVFYPLSCLVMIMMALPFAYLHFRSGGVTGYVFLGVMIGISFFLLNNMFGFIGNINQWEPWMAAGAPSALYLMVSLGGFTWLVLRR